MRKNVIFLFLGILTSVLSKFLQFFTSFKQGDYIVMFSAIFFICSIAFSLPKFNEYYNDSITKSKAISLLVESCLLVLTFQIMMILIVNKYLIGMILIIPICIFGFRNYPKWKALIR